MGSSSGPRCFISTCNYLDSSSLHFSSGRWISHERQSVFNKVMKTISLLGSTGSVGRNCLQVVEELSGEFRVIALAAGRNTTELADQVRRFRPELVSVSTPEAGRDLAQRLRNLFLSNRPEIVVGDEGLLRVATHPETDLVVSSIVGVAGLAPTCRAIESGKHIALANKEVLVVAGELVTELARRNEVQLIPVDSEHNAIHQCLRCGRADEVARVILTASGGPFRSYSSEQLSRVTPEMALRHPTWKMGDRITVDSATMMNKGLEVLEARWLFDLNVDQISVWVHPQSIVHSLVEFVDGSMIAQLGITDMGQPILYALNYPRRMPGRRPGLDLNQVARLEFMQPDLKKFPCLDLAYQAARQRGALPCTLNAADEVAVEAFLQRKISFSAIPRIVARMMKQGNGVGKFSSVEEILEYDTSVRREARRLIQKDFS